MANADLTAVIAEGPFAGLTVQQMMDHTAAVQAAAERGTPAPAAPAPAAPAPAAPTAPNAGNVDQITLLTLQRLEQDDEASFAASVPDYAQYKERIDRLKEALPNPLLRMQKGFHKRAYENLKLEEPAFQQQLYGTQPAAPVVEPPPPLPDPNAPPPPAAPAAVVPPPPVAPVAPPAPTPRPAPPTAAPTPAPRAAEPPTPGAREPKLKTNPKITEAARIWGIPVRDYLLQLEDRGMTQEQIDMESAPRASNQSMGSAAYGRRRAGR